MDRFQRKKTLLKELQEKNRAGGIVDRRFGENDPTMTPEERMLERFTREHQRTSKGAAFNLEDEDELTHYGQSLSKLDDFDNVGLGLDDEEEEDGGRIDKSTVQKSHFGGFEDGEDEDEDEDEVGIHAMWNCVRADSRPARAKEVEGRSYVGGDSKEQDAQGEASSSRAPRVPSLTPTFTATTTSATRGGRESAARTRSRARLHPFPSLRPRPLRLRIHIKGTCTVGPRRDRATCYPRSSQRPTDGPGPGVRPVCPRTCLRAARKAEGPDEDGGGDRARGEGGA